MSEYYCIVNDRFVKSLNAPTIACGLDENFKTDENDANHSLDHVRE